MGKNFLKLNAGNAEMLLIGSRQQLSKIVMPGVTVGESLISPASAVRELGAVFDTHMIDTHMTMVPNAKALSQSARHHIRTFGKIRRPRLLREDSPCLSYVTPGPEQRPARWSAC